MNVAKIMPGLYGARSLRVKYNEGLRHYRSSDDPSRS